MRSLLLLLLLSCASKYPNQDVLGKKFPNVEGQALDGKKWSIPTAMLGKPVLLLIGYKQDSQFDIDRWLIGLDMKEVNIPIYELPTIQGLFPRMFSTKIDSGMRKGIPKELWKGVITIYGDGEIVQRFTGNINGNNARVVLLDQNGAIRYFNDEGFSVSELNNLIKNYQIIN